MNENEKFKKWAKGYNGLDLDGLLYRSDLLKEALAAWPYQPQTP